MSQQQRWKQWWIGLFANPGATRKPKRQRLSLEIETLETRVTPAVNVSFTNGNLSIVGDNAANAITLTRAPSGKLLVGANSVINRTGGVPTINNVASITINGLGGNDVITLKEPGGPLPRVTILGGTGNDTMRSGSGADIINSGPGNDKVFGGAGDDSILGGTGNDILSGDAGDDAVNGQAGNDVLRGGTGSDQLFGGLNNDVMFGQAGDDTLNGDEGNDTLNGEAGDDVLLGGAGNDNLVGGAGADTQTGGTGNDSYIFDPDVALGIDSLFENIGEGIDALKFGGATTTAVTVDLSLTNTQLVAANLSLTLSANNTFENGVGGALNDTFAGNTLVNTFTGGAGKDTFVHHGSGDGIDVVTDMSSTQQDQVSFVTGGTLSAADLTIDATAKELRDVATGTFGFNFTAAVLAAATSYAFGTTDTATPGSLFTFTGTGGFGLGSNADALVASYNSSGQTIGGADFRQRIIDYSPNGNTLAGRDGSDVLIAGDGNDTLNGDQGFNPGGNDTLTGGTGVDTFLFGRAFTGTTPQMFGNDTVTDFADEDIIDLQTGLTVFSGLGTTTVTIRSGSTNFGTIFASNGRVWVAGDFV